MNRLTLFIAAVLMALSVNAQKKQTDAHVMGHVLCAKTGEHIPFANIIAKGTTIGFSSDHTGHFFMKNMTPGTYTFRIRALGYKEVEQDMEIVSGVTKEMNVVLEPTALDLDEVVISSSRNETRKKEAPIIVGVINSQTFDATNSSNLAQGLNYQPGLRVENNCQNCGFNQVRINGLDGPYTQILIDNRPVFSSLAGVYGLEQIPANMIDRVEIVRGGGSALFGSNAIGGTINVITKEPTTNTFSVGNTLSFINMESPENVTTINASLISDNHKAGINLFGMSKNRKEWDANDDGFSELGKIKSTSFGFRSYFRPSNNSKINVEYHKIEEYRRGGDSLWLPEYKTLVSEMADHDIDGGSVSYQLFSADGVHNMQIYTAIQKTFRNTYYGAEYDDNAYGSTKNYTLSSGAQYAYKMDKFLFMPAQLTAGVENNYDDLRDEMPGYNHILAQKTNIVGGYLQSEWKNTKYTFLIGGRLDKHNLLDNPIFSPRINVRHEPIKNLSLRGGFSTGYRAPQTFDEDLHITAVQGTVTFIENNADLRPEYSNSFNLSTDYSFMFGKFSANVVVDGFHTYLKDVFVLEDKGINSEGVYIQERRNGSGATVKGINFEMKVSDGNWVNIQGGFTVQNSEYKEAEVWNDDDNDPKETKRMLRSPDHYGYITSTMNPMKNMAVSLSGTYTGSMLMPHLAGGIGVDESTLKETPNFFDATIKISYNIKLNGTLTMQVNAGVQNLFNSFQKDFDRGYERDAGYMYGPGLPRTIFAGVRIGIL